MNKKGEITMVEPKLDRKKLPTRQENKLLDAAAEIYGTLPTDDMAFTHAVFCQVGLPRAKVEGREFIRQSGAAWGNVQAGWLDEGKGPVQQSIPYGVMPLGAGLGFDLLGFCCVPRRSKPKPAPSGITP